MLQLIDPNHGMPEGWRYVFPETGFAVTGSNFNALVTRAVKHAQGNPTLIDSTTLVARIEDYICRYAPQGYCAEEGSPLIPAQSPASEARCGGCRKNKAK